MNTESLKDILAWIRTTDLVEVSYEGKAGRFSLASAQGSAPPPPIAAPRFVPAAAPAVGVFQWNELGKPRQAEEKSNVAEGAVLGVIETTKGKFTPVKSPCAGVLSRILIEAGQAVEYSQPLFFIEPR